MVVWFRIKFISSNVDPDDYEWDEATLFSWRPEEETIRWYSSKDKEVYTVDKWPARDFYIEMNREEHKETHWVGEPFPKGLMNHWLRGGHIGTYEDSIKTLQGNGKG